MNRFDWYFGQYVSQAEMDEAFWWAEVADHGISTDTGLVGILGGYGVTEHNPTPDLTVDIGGPGYAYDRTGNRCALSDPVTVLDCSVDEYGVSTAVTVPGEERYLGIFLRFKRDYTDPKVDRNGVTVYTHQTEDVEIVVRQGTAAPTGTAARVGLLTTGLLLADVLLPFGATQILNAAILLDRREDWVRYASTHFGDVAVGTPGEAVLGLLGLLDAIWGAFPFSFTSQWFGAIPVAGATPPPASIQAALDAIVYDLADSKGSGYVGTKDYTSMGAYVAWASASIHDALITIATALDAHIGGAPPAHPAGSIVFTPYSWIAAVNVQSAIQEIVDDLGSQAGAASGARRVGVEALAGSPTAIGANDLRAVLSTLLGAVNDRARIASPENITGDWRFDGDVRVKSLEGGGVPSGMNDMDHIARKAFWVDGWASPLAARNTCDLSAYLGAVDIVDLAVGHLYGGTTRPGKQYLYALTEGQAGAPQCSVLVIDPETMARVATWPLAGLGFIGHVAGQFAPVAFCSDGSQLYILFQDLGAGADFVGAISAIDGTVVWGAAVYDLAVNVLLGYPRDRIIVANSNSDLVILTGNVVAGGTGILYSCDKLGVARWGGVGRDGDAILGKGFSGLVSDGTNVYFATLDGGTGNTYVNAATIAAGADPGLAATPVIGAVAAYILDLVFDGRFVRWGTTGGAVAAYIKNIDTVLDTGSGEFTMTNIVGPPAFNPCYGSACHDGDHLCILEYDVAGTNPFERLRLVPGADQGDPWKAGATPPAEPRGQVHFLNPVGLGPATVFNGIGRVAFDGLAVYAVVNGGVTNRDMIRRVVRPNQRG